MENLFKKSLIRYAYLSLTILLLFWISSLAELIFSAVSTANKFTFLFFRMLNDFWEVIIISIVLFLIYFSILKWLKKDFLKLFIFLNLLIVLINAILIKYSNVTHVNLGSDLLGYSFNDISTTVSSSISLSFGAFIPLILVVVVFFLVYKLFKSKLISSQLFIIYVLLVLVFGSSKIAFSNASLASYQNKLQYLKNDIFKYELDKYKTNAYLNSRNDYPYLKRASEVKDVLSPFFKTSETKPNIVIIMVEGLGGEFVVDHNYSGFTPYLDSLAQKSLYWENFLSNAGRTFGVLPSLTASLPFGETGFMELKPYPSFLSIISLLKANGYNTTYYSGDPSSFDRKINYLEYNQIDVVIDESKYGKEFIKTQANKGGFSWGYPDEAIFKKMENLLPSKKLPRLDIVMTLTNHEPFNFPNRKLYLSKVDSILKNNQNLKVTKEFVQTNKNIFASLLYTDTAIKHFMNFYKKRSDFKNTIFIITGDHRLIPIPQKDRLCRFHIPLIIASPLLKKSAEFKSVSSHWDIAPSLISYLTHNYRFKPIQKVAWVSSGLDTVRSFRNIHQIAFMRYKGKIDDYMFKNYFYSAGKLYKVNASFGINEVKEDQVFEALKDSLLHFKQLNAYVTKKDRIFPDSLNIYRKPNFKFSESELAQLKPLIKNKNFDELFLLAREKAFNKDYQTAQLLCNYILNELPNHADARTLKGRTLAWSKQYKKAELTFLNTIERNPYYSDAYSALMDLYWWSDQDQKSILLYKKALKNKIEDQNLAFKMAKAYWRLNDKNATKKIIDSLLIQYPNNKNYKSFKQKF